MTLSYIAVKKASKQAQEQTGIKELTLRHTKSKHQNCMSFCAPPLLLYYLRLSRLLAFHILDALDADLD